MLGFRFASRPAFQFMRDVLDGLWALVKDDFTVLYRLRVLLQLLVYFNHSMRDELEPSINILKTWIFNVYATQLKP